MQLFEYLLFFPVHLTDAVCMASRAGLGMKWALHSIDGNVRMSVL